MPNPWRMPSLVAYPRSSAQRRTTSWCWQAARTGSTRARRPYCVPRETIVWDSGKRQVSRRTSASTASWACSTLALCTLHVAGATSSTISTSSGMAPGLCSSKVPVTGSTTPTMPASTPASRVQLPQTVGPSSARRPVVINMLYDDESATRSSRTRRDLSIIAVSSAWGFWRSPRGQFGVFPLEPPSCRNVHPLSTTSQRVDKMVPRTSNLAHVNHEKVPVPSTHHRRADRDHAGHGRRRRRRRQQRRSGRRRPPKCCFTAGR